MPVSGFQYNTRPYSSFRTTRGSCNLANANTTGNVTTNYPLTNHHNCSKTSLNTNNNLTLTPTVHQLQNSASASSISLRNNNSNGSLTSNNFNRQQPFRSSFYGTRYNHKTGEPITMTTSASLINSKLTGSTMANTNGAITVNPLTPKLVRRIETTCTQHTKSKAPAPPTTATTNGVCSTPPTAHKQYLRPRNLPPTPPQRKSTNFDRFHQANLSIRQKTQNSSAIVNNSRASWVSSSNDSQESIIPKYQNSFVNNANRQSLVPNQKRAYNNVSKLTKENQPKLDINGSHHHNNAPIKSIKSYPAPLPPQGGTPKALLRRKCKEESRLSSVSASPNLNNRRFISSVGINSFNASCNPKTTPLNKRKTFMVNSTQTTPTTNGSLTIPSKIGSAGSNTSSTPSSASQGSPKSKKAFSTKFPQGLPFEDEFYRRQRSYSQSSSSNYSFYSSNGAHTTAPHTPQDSYHDHNRHNDDEDDDEFQRKPSRDESLYVDFSKVMQRHDYHTNHTKYTTTTTTSLQTPSNGSSNSTWIGSCSNHHQLTNYDTSLNSPHSPRRSSYQQQNYSHNAPSSLRSKTKYSQSINDYLYTSNGSKLTNLASTTSDSRKSLLYSSSKLDPSSQNADNGYYTHASPESSPPSSSTSLHPSKQTDIYLAVSSWAPKCSHPTKVLIPAASAVGNTSTACDSNNNKDYLRPNHYRPEDYYEKTKRYNSGIKSSVAEKSDDILERTNSEYSFDSSTRRRKERSKRSHRKSPTSGRRAHKYRYRDDASHSSSRRRHRDRPKDERDSGRNNRRSHSKNYLIKMSTNELSELIALGCPDLVTSSTASTNGGSNTQIHIVDEKRRLSVKQMTATELAAVRAAAAFEIKNALANKVKEAGQVVSAPTTPTAALSKTNSNSSITPAIAASAPTTPLKTLTKAPEFVVKTNSNNNTNNNTALTPTTTSRDKQTPSSSRSPSPSEAHLDAKVKNLPTSPAPRDRITSLPSLLDDGMEEHFLALSSKNVAKPKDSSNRELTTSTDSSLPPHTNSNSPGALKLSSSNTSIHNLQEKRNSIMDSIELLRMQRRDHENSRERRSLSEIDERRLNHDRSAAPERLHSSSISSIGSAAGGVSASASVSLNPSKNPSRRNSNTSVTSEVSTSATVVLPPTPPAYPLSKTASAPNMERRRSSLASLFPGPSPLVTPEAVLHTDPQIKEEPTKEEIDDTDNSNREIPSGKFIHRTKTPPPVGVSLGVNLKKVTPPRSHITVKKNDAPMLGVVLRKVERKQVPLKSVLDDDKPLYHFSIVRSDGKEHKSSDSKPKPKPVPLQKSATIAAKPNPGGILTGPQGNRPVHPVPQVPAKPQRPGIGVPITIQKIEGDKIIIIKKYIVPKNTKLPEHLMKIRVRIQCVLQCVVFWRLKSIRYFMW